MAIWTAEIKELEKLYVSLKGQLPDLEKELERLVKANDENMILLYSRRCLEVIITDVCECELKRPLGTEPLKGIIDKLNKEKKIPPHIITSMHGLNDLSTFGAHPKDFDPEQVKPVLNNLSTIIKWYVKYKETGTDIRNTSAEERKQEVIILKKEKLFKTRKGKLLTGVLIIIVLLSMILILPKIVNKEKVKNLRSEETIIKAIEFYDFMNRWNDYYGKVHLTTVFPNNDIPFEQIIEIQTKEGFYQCSTISGDTTQIMGIQNGECFTEIGSKKDAGKDYVKESDCAAIHYFKEHHYFHFGLLMGLKTSDLILEKKTRTIKFHGFNCITLTFTRDPRKIYSAYINELNRLTIYLDPLNYSVKGYKVIGSKNFYVVCSGILKVNGINMPLCKTYFKNEDNSFLFLDLFTVAN